MFVYIESAMQPPCPFSQRRSFARERGEGGREGEGGGPFLHPPPTHQPSFLLFYVSRVSVWFMPQAIRARAEPKRNPHLSAG